MEQISASAVLDPPILAGSSSVRLGSLCAADPDLDPQIPLICCVYARDDLKYIYIYILSFHAAAPSRLSNGLPVRISKNIPTLKTAY